MDPSPVASLPSLPVAVPGMPIVPAPASLDLASVLLIVIGTLVLAAVVLLVVLLISSLQQKKMLRLLVQNAPGPSVKHCRHCGTAVPASCAVCPKCGQTP